MIKTRMRFLRRRVDSPKIQFIGGNKPNNQSGGHLHRSLETIGYVVRIDKKGVVLDIAGEAGFLPVDRTCFMHADGNETFLKKGQPLLVRIVRFTGKKNGTIIVALAGLSLHKKPGNDSLNIAFSSRNDRKEN
jgi:hypothetical protein